MGFEPQIFGQDKLQIAFLDWLVDEQSVAAGAHFGRFWDYYSNPQIPMSRHGSSEYAVSETSRSYLQAQEMGLPPRITGVAYDGQTGIAAARRLGDIQRKEVVIENDIAWRVNAAVDFLFGKPVSFISQSPDAAKRATIEKIIKALFCANGGIGFFQDMAVLGSVYGFVDCLIRPGRAIYEHLSSSTSHRDTDVLQWARTIDLELIEAPRALPVLAENDYRTIDFYIQHFYQKQNRIEGKESLIGRFLNRKTTADRRQTIAVTEILSRDAWQRYENRQLIAEGTLPWGFLPVVHIQNVSQPYYYEGISDVEVLIPLQDELNTRLSDRASRITFSAFKMYLGKGIEGFENRPVSPGRMWYTDNTEATIEQFGGDESAPSEEMHIGEIRDAMDKVSSITPLAAGLLKNKVGNLTSAVALKLTMMGLLSKTERKRFTYGEGIKHICRMVLAILDKSGIYHTEPQDREIEIIFPGPLPENMTEKLQQAQMKKDLGVPQELLLREIGYE